MPVTVTYTVTRIKEMAKLEEEFMDVLQNIEFALVTVYKEDEEMTDYEAEEAINSLIRLYTAEERKRNAPNLNLSGPAELAFERVKGMCELRLGREKLQSGDKNKEPFDSNLEPIALNDLIACLKRVRRSIQKWNRDYGRRGYYDFVRQFVR
jgi:hypothetical protein